MIDKKTRIKQIEFLKFADWYRNLLAEFQQTQPSFSAVRRQAEKELGFAISETAFDNVRGLYGSWEPSHSRGGKRINRSTSNFRILAGAVLDIIRALDIPTEPRRITALERIIREPHGEADKEPPPQEQPPLAGSTPPPTNNAAQLNMRDGSRRLG